MTAMINSLTTAAAQAKKPVKTGLDANSGAASPEIGADFALMFANMMSGANRQELAAGEGSTSPPPVDLAAQALSPSVNIITTTTPAMSDASLMAFAKAQGLDESAMAMIFQEKSAPQIPPSPGLAASGEMAAASTTDISNADSFADTASLMLAKSSEQTAQAKPVELQLDAQATMRWMLGKQTSAAELATNVQAATAAPETELLKPVLFGLNGIRNGAVSEAKVEKQAPQGESDANDLAATLLMRAPQAAQFAKQLQTKLIGSKLADEKLPTIKLANTETLIASSQTDIASLSDPVQETVILDQNLSGADLQAIWTNRSDSAAQKEMQQGTNAAMGSQTDADVRSAQYEKLSQRLAEALGQRLSAQIARGDWKVELALKPHNLGNIDIQLNMKGGELEASFKASHPMTQELIADGLPRLKQVLAEMGMDIASMNVNIRQNSQNGGNSTPGQQHRPQSGPSNVIGEIANKAVPPASTSSDGGSGNTDGLDILV